MVERTRRHERLATIPPAGLTFTIDSVLPRAVDVLVPDHPGAGSGLTDERTLLVHLFGASYVPMRGAVAAGGDYVVAVVNLGGGSSSYERPFADPAVFARLVRRIREETARRTASRVQLRSVTVSAFSAGYGGVRALLSDDATASTIDAVLLLDGLHANYIPERTVIADGGVLDTAKLLPFLRYARQAAGGEHRMLITHSEIFPGTFASTTETTDWMIAGLGTARAPVVAWGPGGMQQLSELRRGGLEILGFAGNTGPDHIDHLHGIGAFLQRLTR